MLEIRLFSWFWQCTYISASCHEVRMSVSSAAPNIGGSVENPRDVVTVLQNVLDLFCKADAVQQSDDGDCVLRSYVEGEGRDRSGDDFQVFMAEVCKGIERRIKRWMLF